MDTDKYRELRQKYGTGAIVMLSVHFTELALLLDSQKLAEEHPDMIKLNRPEHDKQVERLKDRIILATGELGLSPGEIEVLKAEFM